MNSAFVPRIDIGQVKNRVSFLFSHYKNISYLFLVLRGMDNGNQGWNIVVL